MASGNYTANIRLNYIDETDTPADNGEIVPRAELSIVYRKMDREGLLEVEQAYVVDAITAIQAFGRTMVTTTAE